MHGFCLRENTTKQASSVTLQYLYMRLIGARQIYGELKAETFVGMSQPDRRHGSAIVPDHAFFARRSSWRMFVYIYNITAAGNSVSLQPGHLLSGQPVWYRKGRRYGPSITYKITHAGSLSSSHPGGLPCWASPLAFGLIDPRLGRTTEYTELHPLLSGVHSVMRVKLVLAGEGGGARPPPLITFTLTSKVAVYAPAEWADTLTLFHL